MEVESHPEVVNLQRELQRVLDSNMVENPYLDDLQLLRVIRASNEAHHHSNVCLTLDIFGTPRHLPNDYIENGRVDEEFLVDLLRAKEPVHRLFHRNV